MKRKMKKRKKGIMKFTNEGFIEKKNLIMHRILCEVNASGRSVTVAIDAKLGENFDFAALNC